MRCGCAAFDTDASLSEGKGIPVPETARTVEEAAEKMYAVLGGGK